MATAVVLLEFMVIIGVVLIAVLAAFDASACFPSVRRASVTSIHRASAYLKRLEVKFGSHS